MSPTSETADVYAIVPAAGRSRRMGRDKQLLDVGGRTMLAAVLDGLAQSKARAIVVVTHTKIAEQLASRRCSKTSLILNDDEHTQMIDSVRLGIDALERMHHLRDQDGLAILPADQPGIATTDLNTCIDAYADDPGKIVIACVGRRRGHPIIVPGTLIEFVRSSAADGGLNAVPHAHADRVRTVPCHSAGVVRDVDTPEDYRRLGP